MRPTFALCVVLLALAQLPPSVHASSCVSTYPIGRCGAFDRENVVFCYIVVKGVMVTGTDPNVTSLGGANLVGTNDGSTGKAYFRQQPTNDFLNDPYNAPLPKNDVYQESNGVPGLQTKPVTCASFVWYAECGTWMGPFDPIAHQADQLVS